MFGLRGRPPTDSTLQMYFASLRKSVTRFARKRATHRGGRGIHRRMRVEQLGEGTPEIAIVGGIHGDEPCGKRAVEALVAESPAVERPVKLVVANEEALAIDRRYVDEDLNRAFPGAPDGDTHESRLAHDLLAEIRDCTVVSLHSTQSYAAPFALVDEVDGLARTICTRLTIEAVVEAARFSEGRLIDYPGVMELECGLQGSEQAADNAILLSREFLVATGVLPGDDEPLVGREVPVYRMTRQVPKPAGSQYEVFAANFERVDAGEVFAATDEDELVADEPFYPVLMSPFGYERVFGYAAELCGRLEAEA